MPSTTPDFSTVTAGVFLRFAPGPPLVSLKVEGDRGAAAPLRRQRRRALAVPVSARRRRTMRGGGSAGSGGGGTADGLGRRSADSRSGGNGSLVRACARSRSFRDVEENSRLRFGFTGGRGVGRRSRQRGDAREAPSSCHGGGGGGAGTAPGSVPAGTLGGLRVAVERETAIAGGRCARCPVAVPAARTSPRGCGTPAPSRRAMFFSSRTAIQSPSMIAPVQTPITPARISVLPSTEFVDRNSVADRQQARQNKAKTGNQHANHHRTNPPAAPEMLADRQRHDTVIMCASPTGNSARISSTISSRAGGFPRIGHSARVQPCPYIYVLPIMGHLLRCIRELAPQFAITWKWNCAIWMPGNEAQKRKRWAKRDTGLANSHVIYHDICPRYACAALGGADLRRPCHRRAGRGHPGRGPHFP